MSPRVSAAMLWILAAIVIGAQAYDTAVESVRTAGPMLFTIVFTIVWAIERRKPEPRLDLVYSFGMCIALAAL